MGKPIPVKFKILPAPHLQESFRKYLIIDTQTVRQAIFILTCVQTFWAELNEFCKVTQVNAVHPFSEGRMRIVLLSNEVRTNQCCRRATKRIQPLKQTDPASFAA